MRQSRRNRNRRSLTFESRKNGHGDHFGLGVGRGARFGHGGDAGIANHINVFVDFGFKGDKVDRAEAGFVG